MNVKKVKAGAWLEVEPVDEKIGTIKLLLMPIPPEIEAPKDTQEITKKLSDLILDWNLTEDEKSIPCNDETKAAYIPYLIRVKVKAEEGDGFIGIPILKFAADINNFLKN